MTAPEWVDGNAISICDADKPFHAGITQNLIRGNLRRVEQESRIAYQMVTPTTSTLLSTNLHYLEIPGTVNDYVFVGFGIHPWAMRYGIANDFRPVTIAVKGRVVGSAATVTMNLYLSPDPVDENDADNFADLTCYSTISFTTTSWAWQSCTISSVPAGVSMAKTNPVSSLSTMPLYRYPMCWLQATASANGVCSTAVSAIHLMEVVSSL